MRVQEAASRLAHRGEIRRDARIWRPTDAGKDRAQMEDMPIQPFRFSNNGKPDLSHNDIRHILMKIDEMLDKYSQEEYREGPRRYDVGCRKDRPLLPRISHVFEVKNKGSLENGLANLKHGYDTQRSKPFLVITNERDMRKAEDSLRPHLMGSFHEVGDSTTILSGHGTRSAFTRALAGC